MNFHHESYKNLEVLEFWKFNFHVKINPFLLQYIYCNILIENSSKII